MVVNPSAEDRFLCQILRSDVTGLAGITPAANIDWEAILWLAQKQNLSPLLYRRLKDTGLEKTLPAEILQTLHKKFLENAAYSMMRYHWFEKISAEMRQAQIPMIALKGIYLAYIIYKTPSLRPMVDIDILVKPQHIAAVVGILEQLGYKPYRDYDLESESKYHRHIPSYAVHGGPSIEVHSSIQNPTDPFKINVDDLWQRAHSICIDKVEVMVLDPYDLLLYLCINASYIDLFRYGLKGLYDIAVTLDYFKDTFDWDELYRRCSAWKAEKPAFVTLSLVRSLLGGAVPEAILEKLRPVDFDEKVFSISTEFIFMKHDNNYEVITPEFGHLIQTNNLTKKVHIMLERLFLPRWEMAYQYKIAPDSWRIYFYYLVRLGYLLKQYFTTYFRILWWKSRFTNLLEEVGDQDARTKYLLNNLK